MSPLPTALQPYAKAIIGFITPGAVVIGSAVTATSDGGSSITGAEWVTAIVACIVTAGAVYAVPNHDPRGEKQDESVQPKPDKVWDWDNGGSR